MAIAAWPPRIYWIDAPTPGRLAVMPRPHPDAFGELRAAGIDCIVSLLEENEASSLGLADEAGLAAAEGMAFLHLPVIDHGIPTAVEPVVAISATISTRLKAGQGVAVHCYAGLGRSPLLIAAVLIDEGLSAPEACDLISGARGYSVPEQDEQYRWLQDYELRTRT